MPHEPVALSFSEWFESVVARCQVFIGERTPTEFDIADVASAFACSLPDPRCPAEDLLLWAVMSATAARKTSIASSTRPSA
jgi:hypothetical protein